MRYCGEIGARYPVAVAYRDDKEAAYARADALQRELDRAQAELERTKGKLAETERARDSLAKKLTTHRPIAPPPPLPVPAPARRAGGAAIGSLFVIGAMSAFALNSSRHHYSPPPPPSITLPQHLPQPAISRQFTLKSDPPGAKVYAKTTYGEELVGTTPLTRSVLDWSLDDQLELRLDGYRTTPVNALELYSPNSTETTVTLDR